MKSRFMEQQCHQLPVVRMCAVLGVSSSGYYAARQRQPSQREQDNQGLLLHICAAQGTSREAYGYRRLWHELRAQGIVCSCHRVPHLMRQADHWQ